MDGLAVTNILHDADKKVVYLEELVEKRERSKANAAIAATLEKPVRKQSTAAPLSDVPVQTPRDIKRHVLKNYPLDVVQPYINRQMLIGHHLGLKGKVSNCLSKGMKKQCSSMISLTN